jgi:hypothetical protein
LVTISGTSRSPAKPSAATNWTRISDSRGGLIRVLAFAGMLPDSMTEILDDLLRHLCRNANDQG